MIKILLTALSLAFLLTNSGAAQEPAPQSVEWVDVPSLQRCSYQGFKNYADGLQSLYGETELFLGDTGMSLFNGQNQSFEPINGILVFFVNQTKSTFTIAVVFPDGSFCEVLPGNNFIPYER